MTTTRDLAKVLIPCGIVVILLIIFIVAIYFPPSGKMTCTMKSAPGDPEANYTYVIQFRFWRVNALELTQTITSKNQVLLTLFQKEEETILKENQGKKYYSSTVTLKDKTLTTKTTIRYDKMTAKEVRLDDGSKTTPKKIKIGELKKIYENNGAVCKYR
ncbi:MAG: hypothetical protein J6X28_04505 [Bacilli bacterium]|nr:hypothetical protein [Bacilli bacterium]